MSQWPSRKARVVFKALLSIGWMVKRHNGTSHVVLGKDNRTYVWSFHDKEEIGSKMLARIAKHTGLRSEDL